MNRMSPLLVGSLIIQGNGIDSISAFDRETGNREWSLALKGGVEGGAVSHRDQLFFGANDGFFYSVKSDSGKVVWKFPMKGQALSTPMIHGESVYFLVGNNVVYALDLQSGKKKWLYSRKDPANLSIRGGSQPVYAKGRVIVGFSDGALVALSEEKGIVIWERQLNRNKRFRDMDAAPVVDGDFVYVSGFDDALYCLKIEDGTRVWQLDKGGYQKVTLIEDRIYYSTTSGELLALDKQSGKIIWTQKTSGIATSAVPFKDMLVYGESAGGIQVLTKKTGERLSSFYPGRGVMSTPTFAQGTENFYMISNEANIYALKLRWVSKKHQLPWEP